MCTYLRDVGDFHCPQAVVQLGGLAGCRHVHGAIRTPTSIHIYLIFPSYISRN